MKILKILSKYYIYMIIIFLIGRVSLFVIYWDKFANSGVNYWLSFIYGLRMDTIVASTFLVLPLILLSLFPKILSSFVNKFLKYYFLILFCIIIYIENATFPFVAQYDVRPNYLFVEYLKYPKEVFSMIFAEYKFELFIAFSMMGGFSFWYLKNFKDEFLDIFEIKYTKRIILFFPLFILLFIGIRSSFGHRPANISDALYSSNRTVNEITKNSIYSIVYAIYVNKVHGSKKLIKQYNTLHISKDEALKRVLKRLNLKKLNRFEKTHFKTKKPKNLVIFLQESLGYQFVKAVGGDQKNENITPNFNKLAKEGIIFTDLYSNGTRSVRGIAGMTSGIFSIPGKGVVKRNKSQKDFFTIASALKPYGYHTSFIYGGESRFDNMKGWFLGNGFDEIIDQPKFKNPTFTGTWGVCDADVVDRANDEFERMYAKGEKFASVIFSTSNHSPFDFPQDKIELVDKHHPKSVKNAIKYADFAIGRFIKKAKKAKYYKDTIIVIVADHNIRVYGDDLVPVDMFHIPGLILGGGVKHLEYNKIATQPDVLATVLDLIGLDLKYPIMGHSIFSDKKANLSLMQFHTSYALRVNNEIAVLQLGKKPITFLYKNKHLIPAKHNKELEKDVIAFVITLDNLYQKRLYK